MDQEPVMSSESAANESSESAANVLVGDEKHENPDEPKMDAGDRLSHLFQQFTDVIKTDEEEMDSNAIQTVLDMLGSSLPRVQRLISRKVSKLKELLGKMVNQQGEQLLDDKSRSYKPYKELFIGILSIDATNGYYRIADVRDLMGEFGDYGIDKDSVDPQILITTKSLRIQLRFYDAIVESIERF